MDERHCRQVEERSSGVHAGLNMEDEEEFLASLGMMSKNAHFYSLAAMPQMRARISRHQSAYELAVAPTKHADLRFIDECRPCFVSRYCTGCCYYLSNDLIVRSLSGRSTLFFCFRASCVPRLSMLFDGDSLFVAFSPCGLVTFPQGRSL